jgi:hypothetical protein
MKLVIAALTSSIALVLCSHAALAAQPMRAPVAGDQVPARLVAMPAPSTAIERAPVSFAWKLDPQAALAAPQPYVAQSREYWQTVDAAELRQGVSVKTSAPGALIRVSPARGARGLGQDALRIQDAGGPARIERLASAKQLSDAGMDVQDGTVIAKLAPEEGAGLYTLRATQAEGRYLVHVFEPQSSDVLNAAIDRQHALAGDTLRVDVGFDRAGKRAQAQSQALLVAPDGRSWPVAVGKDGSARVKLPAQVGNARGLWEVQVFASADGIQRDARTAVAVAAPTARFRGQFAFDATTMRMTLPVQAGSVGRYEARGTLYATAPDGQLRPVSQAHGAAWMKRGNGTLALQFDRSHLPAGYGAPFEVRDLSLNDQSRMAPLESRARTGLAR